MGMLMHRHLIEQAKTPEPKKQEKVEPKTEPKPEVAVAPKEEPKQAVKKPVNPVPKAKKTTK